MLYPLNRENLIRMKNLFLVLVFISSLCIAQPNVNYNDLAVIVNDNSPASVEIANYFKVKRNIPNQNIIHISCTAAEEIDSSTFSQIKIQIENGLSYLSNLSEINYIVTTKGVPLKVLNGDITTPAGLAKSASFDSELTLVLGNNVSSISGSMNVANPFVNAAGHFSRSQYGFFIVTRLDGYTSNDVFTLIDKSGPNTMVNKQVSKIIFNYANVSNQAEKDLFYNSMQPAHSSLLAAGWNSIMDTSNILSQFENSVLGYTGIYHSVNNQQPNFMWVNGAVGEISTGSSGTTFDASLAPTDKFTLADLVSEGISGAHGYAYTVFFSFCLNPLPFYTAYTDTANNYNLGESYYKTMFRLSTQDIIIGDPKTSILIDNTVGLTQHDVHKSVEIYPNPANDFMTISSTVKLKSYTIYDASGNVIASNNITNLNTNNQLSLAELASGLYLIAFVDVDGNRFNKRIVKSNSK